MFQKSYTNALIFYRLVHGTALRLLKLKKYSVLQIMYHIDNCSVIENRGAFVQSHVDLHDSANTFYWKLWSCTFKVRSAETSLGTSFNSNYESVDLINSFYS